jgi:hypothetical protein
MNQISLTGRLQHKTHIVQLWPIDCGHSTPLLGLSSPVVWRMFNRQDLNHFLECRRSFAYSFYNLLNNPPIQLQMGLHRFRPFVVEFW